MSKLLLENRGPDLAVDRPVFTVSKLGIVCASSAAAPKRRIDSFDSWHEAFYIFIEFKLFFHSDLAVHYTSCLDITGHGSAVWLEYERKFRARMSFAKADEIAWFFEDAVVICDVLRSLHVSLFPPKKRKPGEPSVCYKCGKSDHFADSCSRQAQVLRERFPGEDPFCYKCVDSDHYADRCPLLLRTKMQGMNSFGVHKSAPSVPSKNSSRPFFKFRAKICRDYNAEKCVSPCPQQKIHLCDFFQ